MAQSTLWWLLAGAAIALELVTGTIYLLLTAVAFAAAAIAAHLGAALPVQLVVAAVVGVATVGAWFLRQRARPAGPPPQASPDMNLDIGERVQVESWLADGTALVRHRGAQWTAVLRAGAHAQSGAHRVVELQGNRLVLEPL
ncbi:NfeD family protein [Pseudacidovorax sp. RU35E]|uniref:NfeD family protein n=1 Tax=Pseudacidovorax sp. RU35E TaxID=1907403 RepID=UPI000954D24B|nr:NfeD family protein [Pseudacidovorax sp. RU35E]SIQ18587.1 Membrane protein implicated in regulation of membrane protease activity [Pseudacidovorax sp. RU35E]